MKKRSCSDDNLKVVTRVYDWDGKKVVIDLCEKHSKDPDFANFKREFPVTEAMA